MNVNSQLAPNIGPLVPASKYQDHGDPAPWDQIEIVFSGERQRTDEDGTKEDRNGDDRAGLRKARYDRDTHVAEHRIALNER